MSTLTALSKAGPCSARTGRGSSRASRLCCARLSGNRLRQTCAAAAVLVLLCASDGLAQPVELVGTRALGMGGAFVAVANDSSATWWNPAGLASGPFLDLSLTRSLVESDERLPASRSGTWAFALGTPPFGFGYYRYRLTDAGAPIAQDRADRQETGEGLVVRSLSVSQFGITVLQTLTDGVHVATNLKYLRGTSRAAATIDAAGRISDLLDAGDDLTGGEREGRFDLDIGAMAVGGGLRLGLVVRNVREPEFDAHRLPRQVRMGAAFDGEAAGTAPFVVALDADLRRYDAGWGERRIVAVGGEHWLRPRRFALRAGARVNTVDDGSTVFTGGGSWAPRAGFFIDGHAAFASDDAESGWSLAARVSF